LFVSSSKHLCAGAEKEMNDSYEMFCFGCVCADDNDPEAAASTAYRLSSEIGLSGWYPHLSYR